MGFKVVNLYKERYDVYIGRSGHGESGVFGNPVSIGDECPVCGKTHACRGDTLRCYRVYLEWRMNEDEEFMKEIRHLVAMAKERDEDVKLGCFCKPQPCHGDVLVDVLNELDRGTRADDDD